MEEKVRKSTFVMSEVAFNHKECGTGCEIKVKRSRNSTGFAGISIQFGSVDFKCTNESGQDYEGKIQILIDLLKAALDDPCNLDDSHSLGFS